MAEFFDALAPEFSVRLYQEGDILFEEGEKLNEFAFLLYGEVDLFVGPPWSEAFVMTLQAPNVLAETGLLRGKAHGQPVTVRSKSACDCRCVSIILAQPLLSRFPDALTFLENLHSLRLHKIDQVRQELFQRAYDQEQANLRKRVPMKAESGPDSQLRKAFSMRPVVGTAGCPPLKLRAKLPALRQQRSREPTLPGAISSRGSLLSSSEPRSSGPSRSSSTDPVTENAEAHLALQGRVSSERKAGKGRSASRITPSPRTCSAPVGAGQFCAQRSISLPDPSP